MSNGREEQRSSAVDSEQIHVQSPIRSAYLFGNVVEHIGLQRHFHVDCAHHPAELALPYIEYALHKLCRLTTKLRNIQPGPAPTSTVLPTSKSFHASCALALTAFFSCASRKKYMSANCWA